MGGFGTRPWWLALLACGGAYGLSPLNLRTTAGVRTAAGIPLPGGGGSSRMGMGGGVYDPLCDISSGCCFF